MPLPEVNHLMRLGGGIYVEAANGSLYGQTPAEVKEFIGGQIAILNMIGYSNQAIVDYINDLSKRMVDAKLGPAVPAELADGKVALKGVVYA